MRKAVGSICLMIGLVAVMLFLGPGCKAEDKQPEVESEIRFSDTSLTTEGSDNIIRKRVLIANEVGSIRVDHRAVAW